MSAEAAAEERAPALSAFVLAASNTPAAPRVDDAVLEYWGQYYLAHELHAHGVLFEYFMQAPQAIAAAFAERERGNIPWEELVFLRKQAD